MSRYLAIDHGSKRVGLALSDPMKIIAKPYKTITYNKLDELIILLIKIIEEEDVKSVSYTHLTLPTKA